MTEKNNTAGTEWRKKWRSRPFDEGYIETKTFLSQEDHERVAQIAKEVGERIPMLLGQIVNAYLAAVDGKTSNIKTPASKHTPITPTSADMETLTEMVLYSRFPGDTGAARFRQIAFINMIDAELARGNRPIARSMAISVDSHPTQIEQLAKIMEARGVIKRIALPGVTHSRAGKVLTIRDDAIEALEAAHQSEVGTSLLKAAKAK